MDIYGLANQLATAQVQPKATQLNKQETSINAEIAALDELSSSLNSFYNSLNKYTDPSVFGSVRVQMQDDDECMVGISVGPDAMPNTYELQVTELAARHKIEVFNVSGVENEANGVEAGAIPADFAGDYTFDIDGESITIDEGDLIGDVASVINDGTTSYLTLTSDATGFDNQITMTSDSAAEPKELQNAKDAVFNIDGITMISDDNEIEDVISGVTFNLKNTTEDPIRFEIQPDYSAMSSSVEAIVESYNDVLVVLDGLGPVLWMKKGRSPVVLWPMTP